MGKLNRLQPGTCPKLDHKETNTSSLPKKLFCLQRGVIKHFLLGYWYTVVQLYLVIGIPWYTFAW